MRWLDAYMTGSGPDVGSLSIAYMLQGASTASNSDPYAMEPASGEDWLVDPPSLMIFIPEKLDSSVFSTDPTPGGPYIMWAGTPYEHLMVPVADLTMD